MQYILIFTLFVSTSSFASDIHLQRGEQSNVIIEGCKSSEYGTVSIPGKYWEKNDKIFAECRPKVCIFTRGSLGSKITLLPEGKVLALTKSKAETKALLDTLLKNGICAKTEAVGPHI